MVDPGPADTPPAAEPVEANDPPAAVSAAVSAPDGQRWPHVPMRWPEQENFSEPWMVRWLEAAGESLSIQEACRQSGVGLAQFLVARQQDPHFDQAALIFDQIVDLVIRDSVRQAALDGDSRAQQLYFSKVFLPAFLPGFASWAAPARRPEPRKPLPPEVARAVIEAALAASGRPLPRAHPPTRPQGPGDTAAPR